MSFIHQDDSGFTVLTKKENLDIKNEEKKEEGENSVIKPEEKEEGSNNNNNNRQLQDLNEEFNEGLKITKKEEIEDSVHGTYSTPNEDKSSFIKENGDSLKQCILSKNTKENLNDDDEIEEDLKKYEASFTGSRGRVSKFNQVPGFTRSAHFKDYALIAPESRVWTELPNWKNARVCFLISKECGSNFSMYMVRVKKSGFAAFKANNSQRFIFGIHGEMNIESSLSSNEHGITLKVDDFAFYPSNTSISYKADEASVVLVYEKEIKKGNIDNTKFFIKNVKNLNVIENKEEFFILRKLIPPNSGIDFNIHLMDFEPGEYLKVKEIHHNQHGLLMLQGQGIYRLADNWFPVTVGDVIWMGPYVLQWYAALGKTKTRYIIYKDMSFPI